MPSLFEQLHAVQLPALRDNFGTPGCTATAPDGVTVAAGLTVRVQRDDAREAPRDGVRIHGESQTADLVVLCADLPNITAGWRISVPGPIGPEVWTVAVTPTAENGEFACRCVRVGTERGMSRRQKE